MTLIVLLAGRSWARLGGLPRPRAWPAAGGVSGPGRRARGAASMTALVTCAGRTCREVSGMRVGRLLAAGLAAVFITAGTGAHAAGASAHAAGLGQAAAAINPSTWAPARAGTYFFDRSSLGGGTTADFSRRESQFGRKFDGHLYYVPADVTPGDLADAHWSLTVDRVPFVTLSWSTGNNPNTI